MKTFLLLLLAGVLTIISRNVSNCKVFGVKCCASDEQLNSNLTMCQKLNTTSLSVGNDSIDAPTTTTFKTGNAITFTAIEQTDFVNLNWMPEQLKINIGKNSSLLFGRQNNCDIRRTVRLEYSRDSDRLNWLPNGSLVLHSNTALKKYERHTFDPEEFCMDTFTDNNGTEQQAILLCPCHRIPCVRKCCPLGEAIICDDYSCDCYKHDTEWVPFFRDLPAASDDFSFEIVTGYNLSCGEDYQDLVYVFDAYPEFLLHRFWEKMKTDGEICGDTVVGLSDTPRQGMMKCSPKLPFAKVYVLANWLHVPEAVLLAAALVGALAVPRRRLSAHSRVHDLALAWHGAALLARCLLWSVYLRAKWSCSAIPIFIYFFSIAASFWLNVLCLNMAVGFWKPLGVQHGRWGRARAMLLLYSAYAWGAAGALTALTAAAWFSAAVPRGLLRPTLHETRTCFREEESDGKIATFAYYYGPVGGLLLVNALLFTSTALRVRQLQKNTAILGDKMAAGKNAFRNNRSVMIYIKLLWLMGVLEMTVEAVAWISNSNEYYFALAASCLDVLRSVAIFVLCCCKRRTLVALRDLFCARALHLAPRWCCPGRHDGETHLRAVGGQKSGSDASVATEVTDSDGAVCECGT